MNIDLSHSAFGLGALLFLALMASVVPWTATAVIAWLASVPFLAAPAVMANLGVLRFVDAAIPVAWCLVALFPNRSPLGPLSRRERACHAVIQSVSAAARGASLDGTLADRRDALIADLETLEPPNDVWRVVKDAQLLDLRAEPPQVGIGDAAQRLVSWPWRVALDHRIVPLRLRLDDAVRARKLRRVSRPGFNDMTAAMRYDYYFLRPIVARFDDLTARPGGLLWWGDYGAELVALNAEVRPPDAGWTRLRDKILDIHRLELKSATADLNTIERARLTILRDEAGQMWTALERRDADGLADADGVADPD